MNWKRFTENIGSIYTIVVLLTLLLGAMAHAVMLLGHLDEVNIQQNAILVRHEDALVHLNNIDQRLSRIEGALGVNSMLGVNPRGSQKP